MIILASFLSIIPLRLIEVSLMLILVPAFLLSVFDEFTHVNVAVTLVNYSIHTPFHFRIEVSILLVNLFDELWIFPLSMPLPLHIIWRSHLVLVLLFITSLFIWVVVAVTTLATSEVRSIKIILINRFLLLVPLPSRHHVRCVIGTRVQVVSLRYADTGLLFYQMLVGVFFDPCMWLSW